MLSASITSNSSVCVCMCENKGRTCGGWEMRVRLIWGKKAGDAPIIWMQIQHAAVSGSLAVAGAAPGSSLAACCGRQRGGSTVQLFSHVPTAGSVSILAQQSEFCRSWRFTDHYQHLMVLPTLSPFATQMQHNKALMHTLSITNKLIMMRYTQLWSLQLMYFP